MRVKACEPETRTTTCPIESCSGILKLNLIIKTTFKTKEKKGKTDIKITNSCLDYVSPFSASQIEMMVRRALKGGCFVLFFTF